MTWQSVRFDEIIADSAFGPRFSADCYDDTGNVATLRTTDLSPDGFISLDTMPHARIDEDKFEDHFLKVGDLVISRSGRIGTTALFCGYHKPVLPGAFLIRFRLDIEKADPLFFRFFFNSDEGQQRLLSVAQGAAQQNINITNVRQISVPLPTLIQQRWITGVLACYDELIETNRRRIALLEESARLLYREWFVKLRFPGHELVEKVDGLPAGWKEVRLAELAKVNQDSINAREKHEHIRYIDIASVETGVIKAATKMHFSEAPGRARRKVTHGDVIWSCVRPNRKSYALIWEPGEDMIVSTGFAVLSAMTVPFTFLYLTTTTDDFTGYLTNRATGAAYPAVTAKDFESATLLKPADDVLNGFHEMVEPFFDMQEILKMQNRKLAKARDALLPKLMSGQLSD